DIAALAVALFPYLRGRVSRGTPTVEEFFGGTGRTEVLGDHRAIVLGTDEEGRGAVAASRFIGSSGEPAADIGRHDQGRRRSLESGTEHGNPGSNCAACVSGEHVTVQSQCGVDGGCIRLVEVSRRGGAEPKARRAGSRRAAQSQPGRLDGHGGGVFVVGGHGPAALPAPGAQGRPDRPSLEAPSGEVRSMPDNPFHLYNPSIDRLE